MKRIILIAPVLALLLSGCVDFEAKTAPLPPGAVFITSMAAAEDGEIAVIATDRKDRRHLWFCTALQKEDEKPVLKPNDAWHRIGDKKDRTRHQDLKVCWTDKATAVLLRRTGNAQDLYLVSKRGASVLRLTTWGDITDCAAGAGLIVLARRPVDGRTALFVNREQRGFAPLLTRPYGLHSMAIYATGEAAYPQLYWAERRDGQSVIMTVSLMANSSAACVEAVSGHQSVSPEHPILLREQKEPIWFTSAGVLASTTGTIGGVALRVGAIGVAYSGAHIALWDKSGKRIGTID